MKIKFHRIVGDGQVQFVVRSEVEAREWVAKKVGNAKLAPYSVQIEAVEADIPTVVGEPDFGPGIEFPHVAWPCPACGQVHHTDLLPTDTSPSLWSCESMGLEYLFLVLFERR